jgi:hypothetical protein
VKFSDTIQNSLLTGNAIWISITLFNDLLASASKSLYVHLTNMIKEQEFHLDIDDLIAHIGLHGVERNRSVQTIKESMQELKDFGFLENYDVLHRGTKAIKFMYTPSEWVTQAVNGNMLVDNIGIAAGTEEI